jgi:hypothetical protein
MYAEDLACVACRVRMDENFPVYRWDRRKFDVFNWCPCRYWDPERQTCYEDDAPGREVADETTL